MGFGIPSVYLRYTFLMVGRSKGFLAVLVDPRRRCFGMAYAMANVTAYASAYAMAYASAYATASRGSGPCSQPINKQIAREGFTEVEFQGPLLNP